MTTHQALRAIDADGRAVNYLSVGQPYRQENPRLREASRPEPIEPRLLARCDQPPGLRLVDVRPNRFLREQGVTTLALASPGRDETLALASPRHEGPAVFTNVYLEGGYFDRYPTFHRAMAGLRRLLSPLSTPGGASSHDQPPQWLGVDATHEHSMRGASARLGAEATRKQTIRGASACLGAEATREQGARGASVWAWASNDEGGEPDVVLACAGDVATLETVAAAKWLRERAPGLKVRVVNVVDLMALYPPAAHPHGMAEARFVELFPRDVQVVFAFHGYAGAVHRLVRGRPNAGRFHVRGYREEGTTMPFDMVARNQMSRYHLARAALKHARRPVPEAAELVAACEAELARHRAYITERFEDLPEIRDWWWAPADEEGAAAPGRQ